MRVFPRGIAQGHLEIVFAEHAWQYCQEVLLKRRESRTCRIHSVVSLSAVYYMFNGP